MTNIGALDIKSTFLDMGAKNNVAGSNQTNFQDTLKNSVKKENESVESVDSKTKDEKPVQKVDTTNKPKVDASSKKEIVTSKENVGTETSEVQDVEQLANKIVEMVAKALGVDVKELEAMMKSLKLEPTELLNLENLQALIVAVTGNDNMLQLLAQPKEITMPITQLISEITALASNEFVQQIVQTERNITEKPLVILPENSVPNPNKADASTTQTSIPDSDAQKAAFSLQDLDESINNSTNQKENQSESKNSNTDTTKTVMTSEELLSNLNKLVDTSLNVNRVENVEQQSTTKYVEIVKQIVDQINVTIKANVTSMEMQLNPESLGRLSLVITSKDGVLKAQFTVSDQTVKQALESQMTQLKDSLSQQGLKIESIEVKLSDLAYNLNQQKQQQQEQQQQKKKSSFRVDEALAQEDDKAMIEGIRKELEIERSTQVDFSA